MNRFFSRKYAGLEPYVPGEQPRDRKYIKLNTNEMPFPPPDSVVRAAREAAEGANLYCDPDCGALRARLASLCSLPEGQIMVTSGSDQALNYIFMAFCDAEHPAVFPDVTYGFYRVFAQVNGIPAKVIPLSENFEADPEAYRGGKGTVFLANPNAPTGIALPASCIADLCASSPERLFVVDEAYVDFGGESCVPLIRKYDNLLVVRTFSKSRAMAGARLGFAAGQEELIRCLNALRYSTDPYNVNSMTQRMGEASLENDRINLERCARVCAARDAFRERIAALGFDVTVSRTNFVFARHEKLPGDALASALRARGILVRHFTQERIRDWNRISIGTEEQMAQVAGQIEEIVKEKV